MSGTNFSPETVRDDDESRTLRAKTRNNFNYVTLALNSIQDGFNASLKAVQDSIIKPALRGGFNVNDIRYYGTLPAALAAIPTGAARTIYITNAQAITANTTVPSNVSIVMVKGGYFDITAAMTLTFNGSFDAQGNNLADLFIGSGAYAFGKAARLVGSGSPETVVTAPIGSEFLRNDGGANTVLYIKESGTGNTGWKAVPGTGAISGSGTAGKIVKWATTSTQTDSIASESGSTITVAGGINTTSDIQVSAAVVGSDVSIRCQNTDNTNGGSLARVFIITGGASGGDPIVRLSTGVTDWTLGIDNSAGDNFTLSRSGALGTNDIFLSNGTDCVFNVNLSLGVAGNGFKIKEGSNAAMGVATLTAGTATVNTTKVTASSRIILTRQTIAGTIGSSVDVTARVAGTSFTITANGSILDTSTVAWIIFEPG